MREVTERGREMIERFEGLALKAYPDVAGYLTIGFGHMLTRDELSSGKINWGLHVIRWREGIPREVAEYLLRCDLVYPQTVVATDRRDFTDGQFDALCSLVFNIGAGAYQRSTLRKMLLAREDAAAAAQFDRWVFAGGRKVPGLITRREKERAVFEGVD